MILNSLFQQMNFDFPYKLAKFFSDIAGVGNESFGRDKPTDQETLNMFNRVDAILGRYPDGLIKSVGLDALMVAKNLEDEGSDVDYGGYQASGIITLDVGPSMLDKNYIISHEFAHLLDAKKGTDRLRSKRKSLNADKGSSYVGDNRTNLTHNAGFADDYSKKNFNEDIASISGMLFNKQKAKALLKKAYSETIIRHPQKNVLKKKIELFTGHELIESGNSFVFGEKIGEESFFGNYMSGISSKRGKDEWNSLIV